MCDVRVARVTYVIAIGLYISSSEMWLVITVDCVPTVCRRSAETTVCRLYLIFQSITYVCVRTFDLQLIQGNPWHSCSCVRVCVCACVYMCVHCAVSVAVQWWRPCSDYMSLAVQCSVVKTIVSKVRIDYYYNLYFIFFKTHRHAHLCTCMCTCLLIIKYIH